jgi:two-component system, LytTR family, response regulator
MIKTIIVDDEQHCITTLLWNLEEYCKDVEVIASVKNATDAMELIKKHKPDLVFLDIEMPVLNGIDMIMQFEKIDFNVVFITAYDQYAIQAIKLNALDYLLKPIDKDELMAAVEKVRTKQSSTTIEQLQNLQQFHKTKVADKIALSTINGLQFINVANLIRVEGEGNYCNFILQENKKILLSKKLGDAEEILKDNKNFFRAHKSHLINLKFVERYIRGEGGEIVMEDGTSISLSRNKKDEFLELFAKV